MREVAVTGMGIVSCIGNTLDAVAASLRAGTSGISLDPDHQSHGFKSLISGRPEIDIAALIPKRDLRFMGRGAAWCAIALERALEHAGLSRDDISEPETGIVVGTGGPTTSTIVEAADIVREQGSPRRIGPFAVPKAMSSTASAILATVYKIKGINFSISSACTTSLHCIGEAAEMIRAGRQRRMIAGGGEDIHWTMSSLFDAMGAMSSKRNDTPQQASRAFDVDRDGFVISGGAGIVVLEDAELARARGATIHAIISGYGATSDGHDMVAPSGEGAERAMRLALSQHGGSVDYINPHATSTPVGDVAEIGAIRRVFGAGSDQPAISATKSMTGHSLGGAGVQEAIYSLLMMRDGFIAPSINVESVDPEIDGANIVTHSRDQALNAVMSNSFGFGGTNGSVIFRRT
jgi:3-oxoacyl-[acyl-carrier-protein] synthase I